MISLFPNKAITNTDCVVYLLTTGTSQHRKQGKQEEAANSTLMIRASGQTNQVRSKFKLKTLEIGHIKPGQVKVQPLDHHSSGQNSKLKSFPES